jgi:hypothetical protein
MCICYFKSYYDKLFIVDRNGTQGLGVGSHEHGNKPVVFIKGREFLD